MSNNLKSNLTLLGLLLLATLFTAYNMGSAELQPWDEARRGINALRMLQGGDYFNYHFLDQTDSFNTKPPLFTWILAVSFKVFGVSLFALRLPSLIALLLFVVVVFSFVSKWKGRLVATYTVLILLLCNGIIGFHVARSGDTDMLFVFLLTTGMLSFFKFFDGEWKWGLPASMGWFALAFLTKGLALALVVPALVAFGFIHWHSLWKEKRIVGVSAAVFIAASIVIWQVCAGFGTETTYSEGYENLWQAMFFTDGVARFSDRSFEVGYQWDFLPSALDIRFSPWIYLLYGALLFALIKRGSITQIRKRLAQDSFLTYCLLVCCSVGSLLLFSQNKHQWYISPMLVFLAYPTALVVCKTIGKDRRFLFVFIVFSLFFSGTKLLRIHRSEDLIVISVQAHASFLSTIDTLVVPEQTPQELLFHLYLVHPDLKLVTKPNGGEFTLARKECDNAMMRYCIIPPK